MSDSDYDVYHTVLSENNAHEVFKKLEDLDNERNALVSRWVWELIQNARGTVKGESLLDVELEHQEGRLAFRHNGAPFKHEEIAHLVFHGSTKHEVSEIGRFGTGFITTHLLSRRVVVRGTLNTGASVNFELNRDGANPEQLGRNMKASWDAYFASRSSSPTGIPSPFTTEFGYALDSSAEQAVKEGLSALREAAPLVFAFNPMLRSIAVSGTEVLRFQAGARTEIKPGVHTFEINCTNGIGAQVICAQKDDASGALVARLDTPAAFDPLGGVPKLFVAFPLNGLREFPLPVAINSEHFTPRSERDGIPLGAGDSKANIRNQQLFGDGCEAVVSAVACAAERGWIGLASASIVRGTFNQTWIDAQWLRKTLYDRLISGMRESALLRTVSLNLVPPQTAWIPAAATAEQARALWKCLSGLKLSDERLPHELEQPLWSEAVASWKDILPGRSLDEEWSVLRLAKFVESVGNCETLKTHLKPDAEALPWLNDVFTLLSLHGGGSLFAAVRIVPNQRGEFCALSELEADGGIGEDLKLIADSMNVALRAKLLDVRIATPPLGKLRTRTEEQIINEILEQLKKIPPHELLRHSADLLAALIRRSRFDKLEQFPVLTMAGASEKAASKKLTSAVPVEQRLFAPVSRWTASAQPFSELFHEGVILNDAYSSVLSVEEWCELARRSFVLLEPVVEVSQQVASFLPDEPLPDTDKKTKSELAHIQTKIAHSAGDDSPFTRARSSQERSRLLLEFLLSHVLVVDARCLNVDEAKCENGSSHRFFRAEWLVPFRDRSWITLERGKYQPLSVDALASLLEGSPEAQDRIRKPEVARLFAAVGIEISDLMLRFIAKSDPERLSLVQSLTTISAAVGNDPDRVARLARVIEFDVEFLGKIEESEAVRAQVERNQALGRLIEQIFKSVLSSVVTVKRTGTGSDYRLLSFDARDDVGQLELLAGDQGILVEIKATSSDSVRMSTVQAKKAVESPLRYILCVVENASADFQEADFRANARFVFDIGPRIKPVWDAYCLYDKAKVLTEHGAGGLALELSEHSVRFRVEKEAWSTGMLFQSAAESILKNLERTLSEQSRTHSAPHGTLA